MARESTLTALAVAQAAVFVVAPSAPVIAIGVWWNSNTVSHYFIHRPFFRDRKWNVVFGLFLSVMLGIPQALWRDRHLAHHANVRPRLRPSMELAVQTVLVSVLWVCIALRSPHFFLAVYVPGYLAGLALCGLHGHFEHARGTTSHYGRLYNFLLFNDGYHVEHHAYPGLAWTELPRRRKAEARASDWPAPLRWLEWISLNGLERIALRSPRLRRFVLRVHRRAFQRLTRNLPPVESIGIVGGGLFPRTAIVLRELYPAAQLTIIDEDADNIEEARCRLRDPSVRWVCERYSAVRHGPFDLLVVPLALVGDRELFYQRPAARAVLVHDWMWHRRGTGCMVSALLLKRLNLVRT